MPNRLATETSPYLLQHAHNPVDWYPWGPEALDRARVEDRPILLSIGYSACHWCHVMAHESFEDEATAAIMNERFINVKVDREERPDVDSLYMTAVQTMTGHGGWPMTVFLTPDGDPFYGGTYFPPEARHGLPAFRDLLRGVHEAYRDRRDEVAGSASRLREALEENSRLSAPSDGLDFSLLDRAWVRVTESYDPRHGGFGGAPKFPQPMAVEFLLRHHHRTGEPAALERAVHTLRQMARGGMYDQVGGGFHRYSVDAHWLVPHFEKMLYDNALLARLYLDAYQATGDPELRRVAEEILDYVRREMTAPEGGFYSAQDADSEGEEGKFYVWTPAEVDHILGDDDGPLFRRHYDVTDAGNFEGASILHVARDVEEVAGEAGVSADELESVLERGRAVLYEARSRRVWPARDEKVITAWNAMMLQAYATAARVLGRPEDRDSAERAAEFLLRELRPEGRLLRTWRDGAARIDAFLEDHALLADALLDLYQATFDPRWVRVARELGDEILERFWDDDEGLFFDAPADVPGAGAGAGGDDAPAVGERLVVRPRSVDDNPTPSGNSAAAAMLLRLSVLTGEPRYEAVAVRVLRSMGGLLERAPLAFGRLLAALDFHLASPREVAIAGDPAAADTRALLAVVAEDYRPNTVLALRPSGAGGATGGRARGGTGDAVGEGDRSTATPGVAPEEVIPLLGGRVPIDGRAAAYVCRRFTCRRPVTEPDDLRTELGAAGD